MGCLLLGMGRSLSPRPVLVLAGLASLGLASLTGCAIPVYAPVAREPEGLPSAHLGKASGTVFFHPEIAAYYEDVPGQYLPEYNRNDRVLAYKPPVATTAIDSWPQPGIPDIRHHERTNVYRSDRAFIFYLPSNGRGGSRGSSGYTGWVR